MGSYGSRVNDKNNRTGTRTDNGDIETAEVAKIIGAMAKSSSFGLWFCFYSVRLRI